MKNTLQTVKRFWREDEGVVAIEYGLLAVFIALVIAIGAGVLGTAIGDLFTNIGACFGDSAGACPIAMP